MSNDCGLIEASGFLTFRVEWDRDNSRGLIERSSLLSHGQQIKKASANMWAMLQRKN